MAAAPTRSHIRTTLTQNINSTCRLCKESKSSKHLYNVLKKKGVEKHLQQKIYILCGVSINECDSLSHAVCRNCELRISKFWEFPSSCMQKENEQHKENLVTKRCITSSPFVKQEAKRLNYDQGCSKQLDFTSNETEMRINETENMLQLIAKNCRKLCTKKDLKSTLHNHTFDGMLSFSYSNIYDELKEKLPMLIKIFDAITGKNVEEVESLKIKYSFVYAILMNCRWHELSVLQRFHTILAIEGGCSKKVRICDKFYCPINFSYSCLFTYIQIKTQLCCTKEILH